MSRRTAPNRTKLELKHLSDLQARASQVDSQSYQAGIETKQKAIAQIDAEISQSYQAGIETRALDVQDVEKALPIVPSWN